MTPIIPMMAFQKKNQIWKPPHKQDMLKHILLLHQSAQLQQLRQVQTEPLGRCQVKLRGLGFRGSKCQRHPRRFRDLGLEHAHSCFCRTPSARSRNRNESFPPVPLPQPSPLDSRPYFRNLKLYHICRWQSYPLADQRPG